MCENITRLAKNADVLVHEATFGKEDADLAYNYYHSTTEQAAKTAQEAGAKRLILTHISARYQGEEALKQLLKEARDIFPLTEAAHDFSSFPIERTL